MKKIFFYVVFASVMLFASCSTKQANLTTQKSSSELNRQNPVVQTVSGKLQGVNESGIKIFMGVPFAQPPVGDLRWKAPQPVKSWVGIRMATHFASRPMQNPVFGDMNFRSDSVSEDCLYLNVWTPAKNGNEKLPVLVYFYGGGFIAGGADEFRYDGKSMARRGVVTVTANYRLGIFGFLALPELTRESQKHSSGNYGYLDQTATLRWVKNNISAFGGDPNRVTIAGESAGSISVSAQMASPLAKGLFQQVIGSSGSVLGTIFNMQTLATAEKNGSDFEKSLGKTSLKELRAMPADSLLRYNERLARGNIDGYFMPEDPAKIFTENKENKVALFIGWNSQEMTYQYLLGNQPLTFDNIKSYCQKTFGDKAGHVMNAYSFGNDSASLQQASTDLASDLFIAFSTWKWSQMSANDGLTVYRYHYTHPRPYMAVRGKVAGLAGGTIDDANAKPYKAVGAVHSSDIEYAMGNLSTNRVYDWQPDDYDISTVFQMYYANFVKTGNPNGLGLIDWPTVKKGETPFVMQIGDSCYVTQNGALQKRYELMNSIFYPEK